MPIIDWKEILNWKDALKRLKPENHFDWIMVDPSIDKGLFALKVSGESMCPNFQENTILIIDPNKIPKNKDFVISLIKNTKKLCLDS